MMTANRLIRAGASVVLACLLTLALVPLAWADEVEDAKRAAEEAAAAVESAQSQLEGAEQQKESVIADYNALKQEAEELQVRINELTAEAFDAQTDLIAGREALSKSAVYEYLNGGAMRSLVSLLLESTDFDDLLRNLAYLEAIVRHQSDEVQAQKERSKRFDALVADLNTQKDAHDKKLRELEAKKSQAEQEAAAASTSLEAAQIEHEHQNALLDDLIRKAEEQAAAGQEVDPVAVEGATTVERQDVVTDGEVQPNPEPVVPPATGGESGEGDTGNTGGEGNGGSDNSGIGWSTGTASAYGGSSDPYTPNPGKTATGAVCDDWSMGVAIPMSWDRYWQYYGRTVEISYNGQTVFAVVNDCGYMGGGKRVLDLQPGVWKAFGFSTCNDWGLRTVNYRFL